jgi:hypothetical protein
VDGAEHIDEPPNARLAVLALLLVWPAVTLGSRAPHAPISERKWRQEHPDSLARL